MKRSTQEHLAHLSELTLCSRSVIEPVLATDFFLGEIAEEPVIAVDEFVLSPFRPWVEGRRWFC